MRVRESFPEHWKRAAKNVGVSFPDHLTESTSKSFSHVLVEFDTDERRDWGSTSIMSDFLNTVPVEDRFGLPRGAIKDVVVRYVSLNPKPIPKNDFHVRYPDVPYDMAHEFVLLHELGHCLRGVKEAAADEYAFARLLRNQDPEARAMRNVWYEKMKDPFEMIAAAGKKK